MNSLIKKKRREQFLKKIDSGGDVVAHSMIGVVRDVVVGVAGGGILGAVLGKHSLWAGALVSAVGYATDERYTQTVGLGMMATGGYKNKDGSNAGTAGLDGFDIKAETEAAKKRVFNFRDHLAEKLFVDGMLKKNPTVSGLHGGYYLHGDIGNPEDFSSEEAELDALEQELLQSAQQFSPDSFSGEFSGSGLNFTDVDNAFSDELEMNL